MGLGVSQAIVNFILQKIYNTIVYSTVNYWENHAYTPDLINSSNLKKVVFQVVVNYTSLFTLTFVDREFGTIATQFASLYITTVLIQVLMVRKKDLTI